MNIKKLLTTAVVTAMTFASAVVPTFAAPMPDISTVTKADVEAALSKTEIRVGTKTINDEKVKTAVHDEVMKAFDNKQAPSVKEVESLSNELLKDYIGENELIGISLNSMFLYSFKSSTQTPITPSFILATGFLTNKENRIEFMTAAPSDQVHITFNYNDGKNEPETVTTLKTRDNIMNDRTVLQKGGKIYLASGKPLVKAGEGEKQYIDTTGKKLAGFDIKFTKEKDPSGEFREGKYEPGSTFIMPGKDITVTYLWDNDPTSTDSGEGKENPNGGFSATAPGGSGDVDNPTDDNTAKPDTDNPTNSNITNPDTDSHTGADSSVNQNRNPNGNTATGTHMADNGKGYYAPQTGDNSSFALYAAGLACAAAVVAVMKKKADRTEEN